MGARPESLPVVRTSQLGEEKTDRTKVSVAFEEHTCCPKMVVTPSLVAYKVSPKSTANLCESTKLKHKLGRPFSLPPYSHTLHLPCTEYQYTKSLFRGSLLRSSYGY